MKGVKDIKKERRRTTGFKRPSTDTGNWATEQ